MAKGWYVLHTYSGYENKIEKFIRKLMEESPYTETVFDVKVPAEDVVEIKDGKGKLPVESFYLVTYFLKWIFPTAVGKQSVVE